MGAGSPAGSDTETSELGIVQGHAYALLQVYVLRRNAATCFARYAHLQLIVLFLVLPGASTTIFRTFLCDKGFVEDKSVSFLEADLTLSCESSEYKQLEVLAFIGLLLYPVGVNALYAGLLFRARDAIQHRDGAGAEHLSFLFHSYAPKYFAFDVIDSLRRILLSGGLVFISERGRAAGGTIIALFFYGLYENVKPYKREENNVITSIANGAIVKMRYRATFGRAASGSRLKNNDPASAIVNSASPAAETS